MQCIYRLCNVKNFATQLEHLTISKGFIKKKKKKLFLKELFKIQFPSLPTINISYAICLQVIIYSNSNIITYADVFKNLEDADNYLDWSLQVKTKLADQQLWDIVEGNDEAPKAESDEAAFKAWSEKNAMALGVIRYSGEGPLQWAIWKITSAKIAWDTLAAICTLPKSSFIGISRSLSEMHLLIHTYMYIYIYIYI